MKKLILLTFLQFCLCSLFAQTDVSTALDLQVGTNSYDLTGQSGYVTLYYKYTAPAESGQLLTFTTVKGEGLSYVMSEDGTYNKMIYGINSATGSIVPVKAGQTVYLILNTRGGSEISFDMKAENAIVEGGQTKEEAIDVTGQSNTYLICIEKNEATGSPDLFDMTLVPAGEGDSFNNPKAIELGENTLPQYNGQYYYSITIPGEAGTPKFLNISSEADFLSSATNVAVYDQNNMYSSLASGTKDVKVEVSAGNTYIICWNLNEDINGFKYNVSVEDIAQGDVYGNPIPAVVGTNDLKSGSDKYYKYTATLNGWLVISPSDLAVKVQFPMSSGPYPSYRTAVQDGFSIKTEIVKGTEYVIQFSDVTADGTFDLEEVAYGEGESKETAIVVEGSSADVPKSAQTTWYRYVAPADGMLEISSDIYYEQNASNQSSTVRVMRDGDSYPVDITKPSTLGMIFFGKFGASKDEVFYVQVVTLSAQEGKTVTFNLRDYEPGELSDNPIELVVGENQLKEASRLNPVWYYADLAEGDLKITSDANNYYYMTLYSADDLNNPLAVSGYVSDENYNGSYTLTYTVETPGKYIMKLEQTNPGGALVTMSANIATGISATGLDAENVTVGSGCITVTPSAAGANVSVYDLSGKMVKSAYVKGQTTFNVEKGLYIVRVNNKAIKVVVKD